MVDGVSPVTRVACVWVPYFVAAAAERCEPALAERPLVVVRGAPPIARVVEANAAARESGAAPGMTETEARARCPELARRPFCEERVASAQHALLEEALAVSPRVEDAAPGLVYVETGGLHRLIGDDMAIGERLVRRARTVGLAAHVGIAGSRTVARVAARTARARVVVVPAGSEQAALAEAPLTVLDLPPEMDGTLARWGVRTLGALARLPRAGLAERLGPAGVRAHDLALGRDPDPFRPWVPPPFWEEAQELDWEIDDLGALATVLGRVLERLTARLAAAHVWADALDVRLQLTVGRHERTIALAQPTRDSRALGTLLGVELAARPPAASVTAVAVSARVVRVPPGQGRLGQPSPPCPRDLAALVARLTALVGAGDFGSPRLVDSHRPDAFTLAPFAPPEGDDRLEEDPDPGRGGRLMRRQLRPAPPVDVVVQGERPVRVRWRDADCTVVAGAGPWRTSGEWWDADAWARDEWDLLFDDGTLCQLARDRVTGTWTMDAIYD